MRKVLLQLFFALTLLGSSLNSLYGEETQLQILPQEVQEVVSSTKTYLFIGEELTQIKSIITQASELVSETQAESLEQLAARYAQGFKTAPEELVVSALEETELLIEKGHEALSDEKLATLSDSFAQCCKQIDAGDLLISINKNNTRSPRDPQAPGGTTGIPAAEAGTLVPTNEPSKDLFVENDLTVGGNMEIHGNTHYSGNVGIDGTLTVGNSTTLNSTLSVVGETILNDTLYPITSIEAGPSGILNVGVTDDTDTLNLGTAAAVQAVNIGTGTGITTINLGGAGDTVNVYGTTNYIQVDDLQVKDKNIIINKDGVAGSATNAGLDIEEGGAITGYIRTRADRSGIEIKAPASTNSISIIPENTDAQLQIRASNNERIITEKDWTNIFVGRIAGNTTMTGGSNCSLGARTLEAITSGSSNVAVGHTTLVGLTTGTFNTAVGSGAMGIGTVTGTENSALGSAALRDVTAGIQNTGLGNGALIAVTDGDNNIGIGYLAGSAQTTGNRNIYIGSNQSGVDGESNTTRIGSASSACYIEGINGQTTNVTDANIVLSDSGNKLGTTSLASANVSTPNLVVRNTLGAATLTLEDGSGIPVTWSLTGGAGSDTNLTIIKNGTAKVVIGDNIQLPVLGQEFYANTNNPGGAHLYGENVAANDAAIVSFNYGYTASGTPLDRRLNKGYGASRVRLQGNGSRGTIYFDCSNTALASPTDMTERMYINSDRLVLNNMPTGSTTTTGSVPMIEGLESTCPRIIYGVISSWTSGDAAGTPNITAPGGWSITQSQATASATSQAVLTFDKPFTTVPFVSIMTRQTLGGSKDVVDIDEITTSGIKFSIYSITGGAYHTRWNMPDPQILVIGY